LASSDSGLLGIAVFCITFLSVFAVLVGFMDSGLVLASQEYKQIDTPDYFDYLDIVYFAETINLTVDDGSYYLFYYVQAVDIGGWDTELWSDYDKDHISVRHWDSWWIFRTTHHDLTWMYENGLSVGEYLTSDILDDTYDDFDAVEYTVKCDHFSMKAFFEWNKTVYTLPSQAWASDELYVLFGISFDDVYTTTNIWEIVGGILFWNEFDIHPVVDVLISIPIYSCIGILIYLLIIKAIPLLGG